MPTQSSGRSEHRSKLYGRRKGKKLSARREELRQTLLPKLTLRLVPGADPKSYFTSPPCAEFEAVASSGERCASGGGLVQDVWFEIGFGGGEHLIAQALANPHIGLIGAEPFETGVAKLLSAIAETGGENIRIHQGDAREVIAALPEASLGRAFILFPDPWPKLRHHKRRLIQMDLLDGLARVMKDGAELRFASDDAGYAAWTLERIMAHPAFAWTARRAQDWRVRPQDWPQTRYEAKALHGPPVFLGFVRRARMAP